jgi:uncharacterized protein (TIGR02466 family)
MNRRLREIILQRSKEDSGVQQSNVGGWHSAADFFDWPFPETKNVLRWVSDAAKTMTAASTGDSNLPPMGIRAMAWANVSRMGDYNSPHSHPDSMWSGVYYVDPGSFPEDEPTSGLIEFLDPRTGADLISIPGDPFGDKFSIRPEAGLLLMFPSWLYHYVHVYKGDDVRISISFNVLLAKTNPSS